MVIKLAFNSAFAQNYAQVKLALNQSFLDGTPDARNEAIGALPGEAHKTWKTKKILDS